MNIQAAVHCYQLARSADNRDAALKHLRNIRDELRTRRAKKPRDIILQTVPIPTSGTIRVRSIFDCD